MGVRPSVCLGSIPGCSPIDFKEADANASQGQKDASSQDRVPVERPDGVHDRMLLPHPVVTGTGDGIVVRDVERSVPLELGVVAGKVECLNPIKVLFDVPSEDEYRLRPVRVILHRNWEFLRHLILRIRNRPDFWLSETVTSDDNGN